MNPVVQRELVGVLRTRKALAMQVGTAFACTLPILLRWPSEGRVGLSGARSQEVFSLFGYGLLACLMALVPAVPAASFVREKSRGTLALLLNTPMSSRSIYFGKLAGVSAFALLFLAMSLPPAAACYAMGGISLAGDLLPLYALLTLAALQCCVLGLWVSVRANSIDGALRVSYGLVLLVGGIALLPDHFLRGTSHVRLAAAADWLRCLSPVAAVMEVLGHRDAISQGLVSTGGAALRHVLLSLGLTSVLALDTALRLKQTMFDRPRPPGLMTDDRSALAQWLRRFWFVVDPQRRKRAIGPLVNPVVVKEFRSRRFGRSHWMLRLVAACALVSLGLTYAATLGTIGWSVETIGAIMVMLQGALIVIVTPSLAAGLISSEHETGSWTLLRMTPLSAGCILRGKLLSVIWPLVLILLATLPGYGVMIWIKPLLTHQISYVIVCLVLAAVFSLIFSATVSSFFRRTAPATITSYGLLLAFYGGTLLFWLGRGAPFGPSLVEAALIANPLAAALTILKVPGFEPYRLVPATWWILSTATVACLAVLGVQTWRLTRPE
jgi:ABC-type transport system involved in multi-copper enzyme maturation permease subunit